MKLTTFILFACIVSAFAAPTKAQVQKVTIVGNGISTAEVINMIESQTDYLFVYNENEVNMGRTVQMNVQDQPVASVLKELFAGTNLHYAMEGRHIMLMKREEAEKLQQQKRVVTGVVTDQNGETIIGASITLKGQAGGAITDIDGRFNISAPTNSILVVSFVGYLTQEVAVKNQTNVNIVLKEDLKNLDEVVVVGFNTQKKVNLTGSVAQVKMNDVLGERAVTNVQDAIAGRIPGVIASGSKGEPGAVNSLQIRGVSSINGSSPLILVDNMPMSIDELNPDDIESVSVLKDASASAIYGARAAFGVILVTTKKAQREQKPQFSYSAKLTLTNPQSLLQRATPLQTVQAWKDAGVITWSSYSVDDYYKYLTEYEANPGKYPDGRYEDSNGVIYWLAQTDVTKDVMETGFQQKHDFSVNGGSAKSNYRISYGYLNQNGVLVTNKDQYVRHNISAIYNTDINKYMTVELSTMYSRSKKSDADMTSINGNSLLASTQIYTSYFPLDGMEQNGIYKNFESPRHQLEQIIPDIKNTDRLSMNGKVIIKPFTGMTVTGEYNFQAITANEYHTEKPYDLLNPNTLTASSGGPSQTFYKSSKRQYTNNMANLYANYEKKLNNHFISGVLGMNIETHNTESLWASRYDLINENLPALSQATGDKDLSDGFTEYRLLGYYYRLNYSYGDRYLFEASGRYDGSSKFPKNHRYGFFPSFSAGWRVSEEAFMSPVKDVVNNLKIRASWGGIGNQNIDPYTYLPSMDSKKASWLINGEQVLTLSSPNLVRSNFTWERVYTTNLGVDLGLFDNRLNATFDIYQRRTLDMLGPGMDYPAVLGASSPKQNAADMKTNGWELSIDWRDRVGKVTYGVGFNLSDGKSVITKFNNETKELSNYYEGKEIGEIWGYESDRLFTEDDFVDGTLQSTSTGNLMNGTLKDGVPHFRGQSPNVGDMMYKNANEDGIIDNGSYTLDDHGALRKIGNSSRRYVYGIHADVSWKGFSMNVLFQGVGKRDLWLMNAATYPMSTNWYVTMFEHELNYWSETNRNSFYPRIYDHASGNTSYNTVCQTRYLYNGAYLDLKSVTLSYELPRKLVSRIGLTKVLVDVNGENLYSWNHLPEGIHPENSIRGQGGVYPTMRMFTFGAKISF